MAVQKSKKSRSRRGHRRSHDALRAPAVSVNPVTGETHLRHHITAEGFYGKNMLQRPEKKGKKALDTTDLEAENNRLIDVEPEKDKS